MNGVSRPEAAHALRSADTNTRASGAVLLPVPTPLPLEPLEQVEPTTPSSVKGRLYGDDDGSNGSRDETAARLKALGITASLFESFPCVLDGHDHKARAMFTRHTHDGGYTGGHWQYYCEQLPAGAGLAEIRAFIALGRQRHVSGVEAARWRERLDYEAGLQWPLPLDVQLPESFPKVAGIVASKMRLFVGLRSTHFPLAEPFVFGGDFAPAYCGLSADEVRGAKSWLERAGVTYRAGKNGRSILWKLVAQDHFALVAAEGRAGSRHELHGGEFL